VEATDGECTDNPQKTLWCAKRTQEHGGYTRDMIQKVYNKGLGGKESVENIAKLTKGGTRGATITKIESGSRQGTRIP